jgi:hypothetical protein
MILITVPTGFLPGGCGSAPRKFVSSLRGGQVVSDRRTTTTARGCNSFSVAGKRPHVWSRPKGLGGGVIGLAAAERLVQSQWARQRIRLIADALLRHGQLSGEQICGLGLLDLHREANAQGV